MKTAPRLQSTSYFSDKNMSKHLAQISHCKTASREVAKSCSIWICWTVLYSLPLLMIFSYTTNHTGWTQLGNLWPASTSNFSCRQPEKKCLWHLQSGLNGRSLSLSSSEPVLAELKPDVNTSPATFPPPSCFGLLLNQLFSLPPFVCVSAWAKCFSFSSRC